MGGRRTRAPTPRPPHPAVGTGTRPVQVAGPGGAAGGRGWARLGRGTGRRAWARREEGGGGEGTSPCAFFGCVGAPSPPRPSPCTALSKNTHHGLNMDGQASPPHVPARMQAGAAEPGGGAGKDGGDGGGRPDGWGSASMACVCVDAAKPCVAWSGRGSRCCRGGAGGRGHGFFCVRGAAAGRKGKGAPAFFFASGARSRSRASSHLLNSPSPVPQKG